MSRWAPIVGLLAACQGDAPRTTAPPPTPAPEPREIEWLHDDYPGALAAARRDGKPIVIDMWAEWCHTCLSMQRWVLTDPSLQPLADRFVWLALDTDKPGNAPALAKFPVTVWPTFFVVSPTDESVQARQLGSGSAADMHELVLAGEAGHLDAVAASGKLAPDDPRALARAGDRAAMAGDWKAAGTAYAAALRGSSGDWPRRPEILVAYVQARAKAEQWEECVALARGSVAETGNAASAADFLYWAGVCVDALPAGDERRAAVATLAIERLGRLIDDRAAPLSVDDRADAMRILREYHVRAGDEPAARAIAEQARALLDEAARAAPDAYAASTFNFPRVEVYLYLGIGRELVPALEASEQALPQHYDPPYRLATVLHELGDHDAALAAANRALDRVYGPRKGSVLSLVASIENARGNEPGERAAREALVAHYESLPEGQRSEVKLAAARTALESLPSP